MKLQSRYRNKLFKTKSKIKTYKKIFIKSKMDQVHQELQKKLNGVESKLYKYLMSQNKKFKNNTKMKYKTEIKDTRNVKT